MQKLIYVGLAGLLGTLGRYFVTVYVARRYGDAFPYGTLVVNVLGCFLVGLLFQLTEERFDMGGRGTRPCPWAGYSLAKLL